MKLKKRNICDIDTYEIKIRNKSLSGFLVILPDFTADQRTIRCLFRDKAPVNTGFST